MLEALYEAEKMNKTEIINGISVSAGCALSCVLKYWYPTPSPSKRSPNHVFVQSPNNRQGPHTEMTSGQLSNPDVDPGDYRLRPGLTFGVIKAHYWQLPMNQWKPQTADKCHLRANSMRMVHWSWYTLSQKISWKNTLVVSFNSIICK